jgi:hypothetical protein
MNPFDKPGQWYKGALHVHTTNSDGSRSPKDSLDAHRAHGYHFLAVTDHNVITDLAAWSTADFLNIPSVEVTYNHNAVGQSYHMCVIGTRTWLEIPRETPFQTAIDRWAETGALLFLAHSYWSGMITPEMLPLDKLTGLEVYNTSSDTDLGKGLASVHWDDLLVRGKKWWGYAVDDTHGINDDEFGGWVWAKADKLAEKSILEALRAGEFYSSSGPQIHDYRIENGVAHLRCSPCKTINFIGHTQWGFQRRAAPGGTINEAEFKLSGHERYLRAECSDAEGHRAWTNPFFLA